MCSVRGPAVDLLPTGRRTSDGPDRQGATSMTTDSVQQDMFTVLHGQPAPVVTRWTYTASDPFAISLAIATRSDRWIEWLVARDLVIESISGPVGEGDIRMTPQEVQGYDIVEIEIRSADGRAVLEVELQTPAVQEIRQHRALRRGWYPIHQRHVTIDAI